MTWAAVVDDEAPGFSVDAIREAARRLSGRVRMPLLNSPMLEDLLGGRVLVKAECLQLPARSRCTEHSTPCSPSTRGVV